jgi:acetoin utilization deacetylase AcuC-like enzyme
LEPREDALVFLLEGGYHLDGLRDSAREVLKTQRGEVLTKGRDESLRKWVDKEMIGPIIRKVKEAQKPFWKLG